LLALADDARERRALDVLHGDEGPAHVLADVVHDDDVLVIQAGVRPSFALEALAKLVGFDVLAEQLDGEQPVHLRIPCQVQGSHAAFTEALEDLVPAYRGRKRVLGSHPENTWRTLILVY